MITNAGITIFNKGHDPTTRMDAWTKAYYPEVSCQKDIKVNVLDNGLKSADVIRIRIPTDGEVIISNGDKVVLGTTSENKPPKDAHTVIGYADNRRGSLKHWKVICQ